MIPAVKLGFAGEIVSGVEPDWLLMKTVYFLHLIVFSLHFKIRFLLTLLFSRGCLDFFSFFTS